jgi:PKD domain-containing protein
MRALSVSRLAGFLLAAGALAIASPSSALAAPPANDNFVDATVISSLPFTDTVDNTEATTEPGEPQHCQFSPQTVWYTITPSADAVLRVDMGGSSFFDTVLSVYQSSGSGLDGLVGLNCNSFGGSVDFKVQAGGTYYVQAGSIFTGGGSLHLNLHVVPPPPNDDFANARVITELPFGEDVDATAATVEAGEPLSSRCEAPPPSATVWYAFTPPVGESVTASIGGFFANLRVYTGNSLSSLTEVTCNNGGGFTFRAAANTTYFFQLAPANPLGGGQVSFQLDVAPQPVANYVFFPSDPSMFDTVQFIDQSFDPGGAGLQSKTWDFGDGATGADCCPTHRYGTDGDYTVRLDVTTFDGRTASTSQVVHVSTHDVAITKFTVPASASSGQTRQISVGIKNSRYPETVEVQLFKSVPGGFQFIGSLTQNVPVRSSNRTTGFDFAYLFTSDDAAIGKVTFKAVANLVGARDALPADNEAIASPTKVSH